MRRISTRAGRDMGCASTHAGHGRRRVSTRTGHAMRRVSTPTGHESSAHTGQKREFLIGNLPVRIHFIVVMIRWTGLAPWKFEFPFPGHLTSTFQSGQGARRVSTNAIHGQLPDTLNPKSSTLNTQPGCWIPFFILLSGTCNIWISTQGSGFRI
jgi:hypothetical protein